MLAVTDAVTLMPSVSGLVFVLGAEKTSLGAAQRALQLLTAAGPADVGVLLNRVNFSQNKHYYHRHYGYGQQSYYDQASVRTPRNEAASQRSAAQLESGNGHSDTREARVHEHATAAFSSPELPPDREAPLDTPRSTEIEAVYDYHSRDGALVAQKVGNPTQVVSMAPAGPGGARQLVLGS